MPAALSWKKIEAGIYTDNRNITLDGYFDEWLDGKRGQGVVSGLAESGRIKLDAKTAKCIRGMAEFVNREEF